MHHTAQVEIVFAVIGAVLVVLTWASVLSVLVVPRRSRDRIASLVNSGVAGAFRLATGRLRTYERRDRVLAWQAAATLLLQLAIWLGLFYLGFALVLNAVDDRSTSNAFAQAGSSLFTLGYAGPDAASLTVIDYLAAASGLVVVALQIGYVMDEFYLNWERWAADLSESHTNCPVLIHFRSPEKHASSGITSGVVLQLVPGPLDVERPSWSTLGWPVTSDPNPQVTARRRRSACPAAPGAGATAIVQRCAAQSPGSATRP